MDLGIVSRQAYTYTVATEVYEGPLDLLLQLIERAELDITKLALSQVTDQYLDHLRSLQDRAADEVSAFLVVAAKLLQIKSEALLPRPPALEEGEEDPGEALARQLIAYKRYKQIAAWLGERHDANLRTYLRLASPPKVEGVLDLNGISLNDLNAIAQAAFSAMDLRKPLSTVVAAPRVTIREKIRLISKFLKLGGRTKFHQLLTGKRSNLDIVVTFLAMLELIKRRLVKVQQETLFGEIDIISAAEWDEDFSFELEFGE
ncbi:MAG: segregation/condensation protein A [Anaerolineales bacterium]|jgi:segregation and condensation protein A